MLKRIRLTDFKSFVDEEIELAPLTLLVGANASGKSNFLDAIRFLQGIHFDLTLAEVLNGEERAGPDAWTGLRGRSQEAARIGTTAFRIESTWLGDDWPGSDWDTEWDDDESILPPQGEVTHAVECRTEPYPRLASESLSDETGVRMAARSRGEKRTEILWTTSGDNVVIPWSEQTLTWFILGSRQPHLPHPDAQAIRPAHVLSSAVSKIQFLDLKPATMREYGTRDAALGEEGKNISGVLADLCSQAWDRQSFVDWLSELCAPEIEGLDFIEVKELGDVMAVFVEKGGRRISARSLSDGTLRFLGMLLALRTARPGSVVLLEEIESGLHPTRLRLLVELLETMTRERDIQVIATTHSPVVLQWLSDQTLRNVVAFGRVPDREGTLMRRLGDLPHFDEVVARAGIEEMFTTGWLEMAL